MNYDSSSDRVAAALRAHLEKAEAGARLPSTRSLAESLGVGPVTVQRAVSGLVAAGLIETRPGSGNFAARRRIDPASDYSWQTTSLGPARAGLHPIGSTMISPGTGAIALHSGYPADELLPTSLVRTALGRAARSAPALHRPPVAGLPELREWFAAEVNAATGAVSSSGAGARAGARAAARASDVLITPGGQSALASIFRALAGPGESIVMESPTYWGAIAAARQAGLIIVPIARGASAPAAADLEAALEASGARLFYAQPNFANPTGAQWSTSDAAELLGVVRARGAFLIEDDWAHEFGIDGDSVPLVASDHDGHVVYVRSLTKSVAPGLRVAAVIAKGPALRRIETDRTVDDLYVSGVLQAAALDVVTQPGWRGHVRALRGQLGERRDALLSAVASHAPSLQPTSVPRGGLNLWLRLPEGVDPDALAAKALTRGVVVSPGTEWYPAEPPAPHLRLNFAGPNPERFAEAAQILGELLA